MNNWIVILWRARPTIATTTKTKKEDYFHDSLRQIHSAFTGKFFWRCNKIEVFVSSPESILICSHLERVRQLRNLILKQQ